MNSDHQLELCLKEIEITQGNIQRYDQNGLTIKSWCLTTWSLIAAYALQNQNQLIIWVGAFAVLAFSFTEFIYRRFQSRFIQRSAEIEEILATGDLTNYRYSVYKSANNIRTSREIKFVLHQSQFLAFYLGLVILSIIMVILFHTLSM